MRAVRLLIQSTMANCNAPEMLDMLLKKAQRAISGRGILPASSIPAAMPIALYPIKPGSEAVNALEKIFFLFIVENLNFCESFRLMYCEKRKKASKRKEIPLKKHK